MKKFTILTMLLSIVLCVQSCDESNNINILPEEDYDNLPAYCDVNDIEGWTNTRFCKNGMTIFTENFESTSQVRKTLMFVPIEDGKMISVYGEFDTEGRPQYLAFDDVVIFLDNYTETTFSATMVKGDEALWTAKDLDIPSDFQPYSANPDNATRAWNENNWVRNAAAVGGVITSSIGVGVGVALTATGVGAVVGVTSVGLSCAALVNNLNVLFGPGESYSENQYIIDQLESIGQNSLIDALAKDDSSYLNKIFKNSDWFDQHYDLPNTFWADLALGLVDEIWGKTITESQRMTALALAHRSYQVTTGVPKEVTQHTAELYGFVSPEALSPLGKYADVEYGIVVVNAQDSSDRFHNYDIVGNGGTFSLLFRGLEANTIYNYFVFYYDKTNGRYRQGVVKTFTTKDEPMTLNYISCHDSAYNGEDGKIYCAMSASITGDTSLIENFQSCGIYAYDDIEQKTHIVYEGLPDGFFEIGFETRFFELDHSNYYAESTRLSFGVYVKLNDGTYQFSSNKPCKLVYDRKPFFKFFYAHDNDNVYAIINNVKLLELTQSNCPECRANFETLYDEPFFVLASSIKWRYDYSFGAIIDGALWIESIQGQQVECNKCDFHIGNTTYTALSDGECWLDEYFTVTEDVFLHFRPHRHIDPICGCGESILQYMTITATSGETFRSTNCIHSNDIRSNSLTNYDLGEWSGYDIVGPGACPFCCPDLFNQPYTLSHTSSL